MIKQHYYTRERRGLYSSNPGYNTVGKSETLGETFVKNLLQEYCFYEIPFELVNEKDYMRFPKAYTSFCSPSGELVLGSSCFIPKDYEGQRSTYFTHNYVIPRSETDSFIKNPDKIVFASGFNYSFDIKKSSVLEEVKTVETDILEDSFTSISDFLKEVKIDEKIFKQILMSCFMAVSKNKKIYIILDVDISEISKYAKGLLKYIYRTLPYEVRRKMGYVTYVKDIKSKEYINLQFLPKGAIKNIGTEVSSGYLFDFVLNRFLTEGLNIENHKYLDFIWQNREKNKELNFYMDTAEELIVSNKLDIKELDELCEFLQNNKNIGFQVYKDFKVQRIRRKEEIVQGKFKDYIDKLDIDKMNIDDIVKIKLLNHFTNSENYEIIYLIQQAMAVKSFLELTEVSIVVNSSPFKSKVEAIIKELYKAEINKDNYFTVMCGFSEATGEALGTDIIGVFKFIYENGNLEATRDFAAWLCSNSINMDIEVIKNAIEEYINLYDNKIFKNRSLRNLLMKASKGELREFLKKEEYKRVKGIRKIFLKWR